MKQVLLTDGHKFSQLFYQFVNGVGFPVKINSLLKEYAKIIVALELERRIVVTCILGILLYKFRNGQEPCRVNLPPIDKIIQISFHFTILLLGLAVCLQIKCDGKLLLNAKEIA